MCSLVVPRCFCNAAPCRPGTRHVINLKGLMEYCDPPQYWCENADCSFFFFQAASQSAQPLKFTTTDSCDRIKDEFQFLQAQYHRYGESRTCVRLCSRPVLAPETRGMWVVSGTLPAPFIRPLCPSQKETHEDEWCVCGGGRGCVGAERRSS